MGRPVVHMEFWSEKSWGAYARKSNDVGRKIVVGKVDVTGIGELSLLEDPDARVPGMWKQ